VTSFVTKFQPSENLFLSLTEESSSLIGGWSLAFVGSGFECCGQGRKGGSKVKSKRIKGWVLVNVDRVRQEENESTKPGTSSLTLNRRAL